MRKIQIKVEVRKRKDVKGNQSSNSNFDENYAKANVVPLKLQEYITDLNHLFSIENYDFIRGRENEVKRIFQTFQKTQNNNVMLLGDRGVGKTAIIQSVVNQIIKNECPEKFNNHHMLYLDLDKLIIYTSNPLKDFNETLKELFDFILSPSNAIIVIDSIHKVVLSSALLYYLEMMLNNATTKVIGITTEEEYETYFAYATQVTTLFDIIRVNEPKSQKVYPMISEHVKLLEKAHDVKVSEETVKYIVSVSAAFSSKLKNPGLALNFIEKSMIIAKERNHKEVLREDVNSNFNFNYELYNRMSDEDKKITAYHEAGHFIVAEMSENIKNFKTTAITIVPAEDFLGVTMFEFEPEKQTSCNSDYFIDNIAADLAGRIAETILQGTDSSSKLTSGASSDLKNATRTARAIVTEYGMIEACGHNMTYFCDYDLSDLALLSEDRKKKIDTATENLIKMAYARGKKILAENRELLDVIANALLENEVLDEKDLKKLCAQVEANK